jgi:agmatine deiminase
LKFSDINTTRRGLIIVDKMKNILFGLILVVVLQTMLFKNLYTQTIKYTMPAETGQHEGTWLQWPHNYTYPPYWREDLEPSWIEMTKELQTGEKVHIIAYDENEKNHIIQVLNDAGVGLTNVDFFVHPDNDVWVRDNGPVFVFDEDGFMFILDWGFNGWGGDAPYELCDSIPVFVSGDIDIPFVDLSMMVLEGGAMEIDGNGSMMATKSSILNPDRNPFLTQSQVEEYLTINLGVTNFIWLEGVPGLEITDMHIDGFARFNDSTTIVCMDSLDLIYWEVPPSDINTLFNSINVNGDTYNYVYLPLTANDVVTTYGQHLGYKGSYVNYYIGNDVVLVPKYNDPNDDFAIAVLQSLFPSRTVVGIDVRNLYSQGGMIHCVTQQQPYYQQPAAVIEKGSGYGGLSQNKPNPFNNNTIISFVLHKSSSVKLEVFNTLGQKVKLILDSRMMAGDHSISLDAEGFEEGIYSYILTLDGNAVASRKMAVVR